LRPRVRAERVNESGIVEDVASKDTPARDQPRGVVPEAGERDTPESDSLG